MTIDPEYRNSAPARAGDAPRGRRRLGVVVGAAVVIGFGLLLGFPGGATTDRINLGAAEIAAISESSPAAASSTGRASSPSLSGEPLNEAVPGFVDTITAVTWRNPSVDVLRWVGSESAPATMLRVDDRDGGWNGSVDASGRWFVETRGASSLAVFVVNDSSARSHEPRRLSGAFAGARAWSAAWHDSRPGRLAWLQCSRGTSGPSTEIRTTDLAGGRAASVTEPWTFVDLPCDDLGTQLLRWGDWGALLQGTSGSGVVQVLVDAAGSPLAAGTPGPDGVQFVGVGPGRTTVWTGGPGASGASSFLLAPSGEHAPVPGLAGSERLESALASPDGSLLALVADLVPSAGSVIRIAEVETGEIIAEIPEPGPWLDRMVWSSDNRFLVYERWPESATIRRGVPQQMELVFYDTETDTSVALPVAGYTVALRSAR